MPANRIPRLQFPRLQLPRRRDGAEEPAREPAVGSIVRPGHRTLRVDLGEPAGIGAALPYEASPVRMVTHARPTPSPAVAGGDDATPGTPVGP